GVAIEPADNQVIAPMACTVQALYPTLHAVGLLLDNGVELLIHIGQDPVELEGRYFEKQTEIGDRLQAGDPIVSFDAQAIRKAGYELLTPIIVTNSSQFAEIKATTATTVNEKAALLFIKQGGNE